MTIALHVNGDLHELTPIPRPRFFMSCGTNSRCTVRSSAAVSGNVAPVWSMWMGEQPFRAFCRSPLWASARSRRSKAFSKRQTKQLQYAFIDEQAAQCGYCISGMVMRAQALLRANPHPTDDEIRKHMRPNLCRCGTHAAICAPSSARRSRHIPEKCARFSVQNMRKNKKATARSNVLWRMEGSHEHTAHVVAPRGFEERAPLSCLLAGRMAREPPAQELPPARALPSIKSTPFSRSTGEAW